MRRFGSVRPHSPRVIDRRWNDIDVSDGRRGDPPIGDALAGNESSSIDELLDRAVAAINRGDRMTANSLAQQVLTADKGKC